MNDEKQHQSTVLEDHFHQPNLEILPSRATTQRRREWLTTLKSEFASSGVVYRQTLLESWRTTRLRQDLLQYEPSAEFQAKVDILQQNLHEWITQELGIAVPFFKESKAFVLPEDIFASFYPHRSKEQLPHGFYMHDAEAIILREQNNWAVMLSLENHENLHQNSYHRYMVHVLEDPISSTVLEVLGTRQMRQRNIGSERVGAVLDEVLTETANLCSVQFLAKSHPELSGQLSQEAMVAYPLYLSFFYLLHECMAEELGVHVNDLEKQLFFAYFTGSKKTLHMYDQVFGPGALKIIMNGRPLHIFDIESFLALISINLRKVVNEHNMPLRNTPRFVGLWNAYQAQQQQIIAAARGGFVSYNDFLRIVGRV